MILAHASRVALITVALSSCIAPARAPSEPVLGTVDSPTSVDVLRLRGTKQAATGVEVKLTSGGNPRDPVVVPLDDATQWAVDVPLLEGDNTLEVSTLDGAGRRSPSVIAVVVLDTEAPDVPEDVVVPSFTALDALTVTGTVAPGEDVVINGVRSAVGGGAFSEEVALTLGENRVRVAARDLAGNESDVLDFVVVRVAEVEFTLDPPPALVSDAALTLSGTRGEGVEVVVDGAIVVAATEPRGVDGAWSAANIVLAQEGPNAIEVVGRFPGEDETAVLVTADITLDTTPPLPPLVDPLPAFTALDTIDVTGTVTPDSGDEVIVNDLVSPPDDVVTGAFSVTVAPLALGDNVVTVQSRDAAGNVSAPPVVQTVTRVNEVPFTVDPPPALVGGDDVPFSFTGTRGAGVEVTIDDVVVVPATDPAGPWQAEVALVDGGNTFVLTASFPGEADTARIDKLVITADLAAPAVVIDEPLDGALAGNVLTVAGTAIDEDDNGAAVRVCVGLPRAVDAAACVDDADYDDATLAGDAFTIAFDLSTNASLSDGDPGAVYLRAEDSLGSVVEIVRDVLVFRAPLVVDEAAGVVTGVDLVRPTAAPVAGDDAKASGALVWSNSNGDSGLALDDEEGPGPLEVAWRPVDLSLAAGAATASDVHVASNAGVVHVVWIDGGDLMYSRNGNGDVLVVDGGALDPVTSVDVAFDADANAAGSEAVIAFVQNVGGSAVSAVVRTTVSATVSGSSTFSPPLTISDATAASASVRSVAVAPGGHAIAWVETSARDGTLDDDDVVLVARAGGTAGAPVLVSASQVPFVDDASSAPRLATLGSGDVAVAWIEGSGPAARGVATIVDVDALPSPTVPAPVDVTEVTGSGAASSLFVEVDTSVAGSNTLLFGWLDDGTALLDGAAAPVLVVRRAVTLAALGAPVVIPSEAASSPTGFLDGSFATLAWVEGGNALLTIVEVP